MTVNLIYLVLYYRSKLKVPESSEGFTEIVRVNFVPKFKDSENEKLYKQYLLEK